MQINEYLTALCSSLSIPYWKNKIITFPRNMKIVHNDDFNAELLRNQIVGGGIADLERVISNEQ